ncbi:MAG: N-acetylmuramoyl-L-alanine amidase [Xanthomonadales bacterium]|nr:N-acetylmuramoyl-L-alanine amidase [Xanthomonadales bacterium]
MFVNHLPYVNRLDKRSLADIDLVVIHCTELPDLAMARVYGERIRYPDSGTGNCGHYYVERAGRVEEWVPPDRIAHHVRGYNENSIGIELDNPGRYPDWFNSRSQKMQQPYTAAQLDNLVRLLHLLRNAIPGISLLSGHDMLDLERVTASDDPGVQVRRKMDPGPLFPWDKVLAATGLGLFKPQGPRLELVSGHRPR